MTVIVGLKHGKDVYIAADRFVSLGGWYGKRGLLHPKITRCGGCIIGVTGRLRVAQSVFFKFKPPKYYDDISVYQYMATLFVDELKKTLKEQELFDAKKYQTHGGTQFLVGVRSNLFFIAADLSLYEADDFVCCGAGGELASGSMEVLKQRLARGEVTPQHCLNEAITTATQYSSVCSLPVDILKLNENNEGGNIDWDAIPPTMDVAKSEA